jgi:type IV pilus assembly protein PilC
MVLALVATLIWMHKSDKGRMVRDKLFLRVPLVKEVVLYAVVERVCRIVAAMVKAGVPLPDTIAAAIQGTNNKVFEEALQGARERMLEGEGLAQPITDCGLFPRAATQMMRVGEDTGTLDIQLDNAAQYYGRELEYKLKKLTSLFEPAVIIFMGLVVGFVAVALISAMYGIFGQSKNLSPK